MIDAAALARDTAAVVQVPSITGDERAALERLGELDELPVAEHVAVYEDVQRRLATAMGEANDPRPPPGPG